MDESTPIPPRLSVVIPAYNEADNLDPLLAELLPVMDGLGQPYEVVVVDDGSTDGTAERLRELAGRHPVLRPLRLAHNAGQSAAFMAGFEAARGELVVTMDADLQNDPADIPTLIRLMDRYDVVCGVRRRRRDTPLRRISSRVANAVRRRVVRDAMSDVGCSLKVFRRADLIRLPRFDGMHRFFPVLLQWLGCRVGEVTVGHRPRHAGTAKYNLRNRAWRAFVDLLGVRWMKSRWLRYEVDR